MIEMLAPLDRSGASGARPQSIAGGSQPVVNDPSDMKQCPGLRSVRAKEGELRPPPVRHGRQVQSQAAGFGINPSS